VTTHDTFGIVVWSSRKSSGSARTTIEESAKATAIETTRAISRRSRVLWAAGAGEMAAAYALTRPPTTVPP
jgi:hypothetical protein